MDGRPVERAARALRARRWEEAREAFELALRDGESAEALDGLGETLWWLGDPRASVRLRERAFAAFLRAGDRVAALRAAVSVCLTYRADFGNPAAARGWARRAARLADGDGDALAAGWARLLRAGEAEDARGAAELAAEALAAARARGDPDLELCALSELGRASVAAGDAEVGFELLDEAMAGVLAGEWTNPETAVFASCHMLGACAADGDVARAAQWCAVADRLSDELGCPFLYVFCRTQHGGLLAAAGRWDDGEAELRAGRRAAAGTYPAMHAQATARLALLLVRRGRPEEAEELLSTLDQRQAAAQADAELLLARSAPAEAAALLGRHLGGAPARPASAPLHALRVRALLASGDADAAAVAADRLVRLAAAPEWARAAPWAELAAGLVAQARGEGDAAARALARAADGLAALGLPFESALARLALAEALAAAEPRLAVAEGRTALAALERLGASAHADAAAALLRSLGAPGRPARRTGGPLTRREGQVLELLGLGLSNPEIAERLVISRKTAAHHVSSVLAKLGLRNRAEAVAYAARSASRPPA